MAVQKADYIWRNFEVDGVSASGFHKPVLGEQRVWGTWVEQMISAGLSNGGLIYDTKASMDADLAHDANASAWVMTGADAGIYRKSGASGSGAWTKIANLPYSYIKASNVGAGTANALQVTTDIPVPAADGAALIALPIAVDNTASPVTVSFNDSTPLTIKTSAGNDVASGGLKAGMMVAGYISGPTFRLLSDQASDAIQAAAEAAQEAAEAAALTALQEANIKAFGAKGDGKYGSAGAVDAASTSFVDAGAAFTMADVGKLIRIDGAGAEGAKLVTTIAAVTSPTAIELTDPAQTTVAAAKWVYGTDDTAAIDAAFAYVLEQDALLYNSSSQRNIIAIGNAFALRWSGGYYLYNGTGYSPTTPGGRILTIHGDGSSSTIVEITSDAYLIECPEDWTVAFNFLQVSGLKICGGKGLFINLATYDGVVGGGGGGVPQAGYDLHDVRILDFSEVGFGSYWEGTANWSLTYCWIETTRPNTKGLLLGPQVANPDLTGTTIVGCTYKIVMLPVGQTSSFIQNLAYMHSLSTDDHEADIWFMAIDTNTEGFSNVGYAVWVKSNRLSNEFRGSKPVFLVADSDDNGDPSTPLHKRRHLAATTNKVFRDIFITDNVIGGVGTADSSAPLMLSYTQELGRLVIRDNALGNSFTHLLYLEADPAGGYVSDAVLGPNDYYGGGGEKPLPCNKPIGIWRGPIEGEEIPSPGTPLSGSGGYDPNYKLMSIIAGDPVDGNEITVNGGVTRALVTDALGGSNAEEFTFSAADATDWVNIPIGSVDADPYGNVFVEFDVKQAASQMLREIDVEIRPITASGDELIRRAIMPSAEWLPVRIPFNANAVLTGLTVRFFASPDDFSAGVRDKVQIGRPHIYRANRPVNRDHAFIAGHKWNGPRELLQGPETSQYFTRWIDWANGDMRAKFSGVPASESDPAGLLIPMMLAGGAGAAFTPTIVGGTSAGVGTYTANAGRYFKLGKLIAGTARVIWTAHTGTGSLKIAGLPLPCRNLAESRGAFFPIFVTLATTAGKTLAGFVNHNSTEIVLTERDNVGDTVISAVPSSGTVYFGFLYEAG